MCKKLILLGILMCAHFQPMQSSTAPVSIPKISRVVSTLKQKLIKHKYLCATVILGATTYYKRVAIGNIFMRLFNAFKARFTRRRGPAHQPAPEARHFLPIEQYPATALFDAIEHNDIELLRHLLPFRNELLRHDRPRFELINAQHNTLLAKAVELNNVAMVHVLLDAGMNLQNNPLQPSALHVAAQYGAREAAHELLNHPRRLDVDFSFGKTALHTAAEYGHNGVIEELLLAGANVNRPNIHQKTPLYIAASNGHSESVAMLAAMGGNLDPAIDPVTTLPYHGEGPLHAAAVNRHFDTVRTLIQAGANINAISDRGLLFDQVIDDPAIMIYRRLTDDLGAAVRHADIDAVTALLDQGASALSQNTAGTTAIHSAIGGYEPASPTRLDNIARLIIQRFRHRATMVRDAQGRTLLHKAALNNNTRIARLLLRHGIDVNAQDNEGNTALHYAADRHMRDLLLITAGADPTILIRQAKHLFH